MLEALALTALLVLVVPKFHHEAILFGDWTLLSSIYFVLTAGTLLRVKYYTAWAFLQVS